MGRNYARTSDPQFNDLGLIWDSSNSDWRLATLEDIQLLFDTCDTEGVQEANTQSVSPNSDCFNIQVNDNNEDTHLLLTPTDTFSSGTITLPQSGSLRDKQIVIVTSTQQISSLTVDANGAAVINGAPIPPGVEVNVTVSPSTAPLA